MYTEHVQNTDVQSLQSSFRFLRLRELSSHCAGSSSFITNPTKHSPSWEANKYQASQEIPCIYVIWTFIIKFQRPVNSTRSDSQCACFIWKSYTSYQTECYLLRFFIDCVFCNTARSFSAFTSTSCWRSWPCSCAACSFVCSKWWTSCCTSFVHTSYNASSCSLLPYSVATGNLQTNAWHLLP